MKAIALITLVLLTPGLTRAQIPTDMATRSVSQQFTVFSAPDRPWSYAVADAAARPEFIVLQPTLLAVACERLKQDLYRELDLHDPWQDRIYVHLLAPRSPDDGVTILADRFEDGWAYRVTLPAVVHRDRYARVLVQVLLTEIANRNAIEGRSAEIPHWLAEGFTRHLLGTYGTNFLLLAPNSRENGLMVQRVQSDEVRTNVLHHTLETLRSHPPLTFDQLSWPRREDFSGEQGEVFRSSAHLFVRQLLAMKDGRARLRNLLSRLPQRHNWQFALFDSFQPELRTPLDAEKWWALQVVQFTGRDLIQTWSREESGRKLDEILRAPVQVRTQPQDLPEEGEVPLQKVIAEWNALQQGDMLNRKVRQLELFRMHAAAEYMPLVDEYRAVIMDYLNRRKTRAAILPFGIGSGIRDRIADDASRRLDALDAQRDALRPQPPPVAASTVPVDSAK